MPLLEFARQDLARLGVVAPIVDRCKSREAVFLLLERADGKLSLIELLTVVGVADHLSINEAGIPISGDDYLSLPIGLVPISLLLELLGMGSDHLWEGRGRVLAGELFLEGGGVCKMLSKGSRQALERAFDGIHGRRFSEVIEFVSERCPEWYSSFGKVVHLPEVFVAFGASQIDAQEWVRELRSHYSRHK